MNENYYRSVIKSLQIIRNIASVLTKKYFDFC